MTTQPDKTRRSKKKPDKKRLILDAAARVVDEQGAGHLTIDAVAASAGISKGGVLYHFPNKQTLLRGMLDQVIESQKLRIEHNSRTRGGAHAHVTAVLQSLPKSEWTASLAILAAAAEDPDLLQNARSYMRRVIDELSNEPHFADALMVILAAEGLRIMDTLNLVPITAKERSLLKAHLLERAEQVSP